MRFSLSFAHLLARSVFPPRSSLFPFSHFSSFFPPSFSLRFLLALTFFNRPFFLFPPFPPRAHARILFRLFALRARARPSRFYFVCALYNVVLARHVLRSRRIYIYIYSENGSRSVFWVRAHATVCAWIRLCALSDFAPKSLRGHKPNDRIKFAGARAGFSNTRIRICF